MQIALFRLLVLYIYIQRYFNDGAQHIRSVYVVLTQLSQQRRLRRHVINQSDVYVSTAVVTACLRRFRQKYARPLRPSIPSCDLYFIISASTICYLRKCSVYTQQLTHISHCLCSNTHLECLSIRYILLQVLYYLMFIIT